MNITSMFGGTVVFLSPGNQNAHIEATISGLTKAPHYKLDDAASMARWKHRYCKGAKSARERGKVSSKC